MARKYAATRRPKRIPRKAYRKKYKINKGRLLDSRINTTIERRMKEIAINEHNKLVPKLIFRQFLMGTYNQGTNIFGQGSRIDWQGQVMTLVQIQKIDNATAVAIPAAPNVQQTPASYQAVGGNLIAPIFPSDGWRDAMFIRVHGVSLDINIEQPRVLDVHQAAADSTPVLVPTYSYIDVWFSVLTTYYHDSDLIAAKPDAEQILQVPIYGFNSRLDSILALDDLGKELKTRVLWKKKVRMRISLAKTNITDRKYFLNFKKRPIKIQYHELDQAGQAVIGPKLFFVVRSTCPSAVAYDRYKPRVRLVAKTFYTNLG